MGDLIRLLSPRRALVIVDAKRSALARYESGPSGARPTLTHAVVADTPVSFTPGVVERFRRSPEERFRLPSPLGAPCPGPPICA
jgi:hypothetical protein